MFWWDKLFEHQCKLKYLFGAHGTKCKYPPDTILLWSLDILVKFRRFAGEFISGGTMRSLSYWRKKPMAVKRCRYVTYTWAAKQNFRPWRVRRSHSCSSSSSSWTTYDNPTHLNNNPKRSDSLAIEKLNISRALAICKLAANNQTRSSLMQASAQMIARELVMPPTSPFTQSWSHCSPGQLCSRHGDIVSHRDKDVS
jgi:hypothetical protein